MILKDHKVHITSKLTVLEGDVIHRKANNTIKFNQYDEVEKPNKVTHFVEVMEDSLCVLSKGEKI